MLDEVLNMKKRKVEVGSYKEAFAVAMGWKKIGRHKTNFWGKYLTLLVSLVGALGLLFGILMILDSTNIGLGFLTDIADNAAAIIIFIFASAIPLWIILIVLQVFIYGKLGILGYPKVVRNPGIDCQTFYEACVKAGIKEPITAVGQARMQNVAQMLKISADIKELMAAYREGAAYEQNERNENAAQEKRSTKLAEQEEKAALDRFLGYTGKEKRKRMILAEMPKEMHMTSAGSVLYQKEKDWATAGGIASGLAGGAAGLAVAADVQAKNAQIRANNAAMKPLVDMLDSQQWEAVRANRDKIASCKKQLERVPILLMDEHAKAASLMAKLRITEKVTVSTTGTVTVNATLQATEELKIMNEVPAAIDGFVSVVLKDERGNSDEIVLTLPTYGVTKKSCSAKAMSTHFTNPNAHYTIAYKPKNLWLIEK